MKRKILLLIALFIEVLCISCLAFFIFYPGNKQEGTTDLDSIAGLPDVSNENQEAQRELTLKGITPEEIMEIIKTDKDYNDLSGFIKDFEPEVVSCIKLGADEYKKIKPEWQEQGFEDRIGAVDGIELTDSTYWIELKNKKDETKGLRMILDIKERKSLLLIASLSINVGIGM
jgi:hypothetical protein